MTVAEKTLALLSERTNLDEVSPSASLDSLGFDSLDIVELGMVLEDELGAPSIGGSDWDRMKTVQDLIDFCSREK